VPNVFAILALKIEIDFNGIKCYFDNMLKKEKIIVEHPDLKSTRDKILDKDK